MTSQGFVKPLPTIATMEQVETLHGCQVGFLWEGRIFVVKMTDSARTTVDAWAQRATDLRAAWAHPVVLTLLDMTAEKAGPTPYIKTRSQEILKVRPDLRSFFAFNLSKSVVGRVVSLALRSASTPTHTYRAFFNEREAIDWLMEHVNG